MTEELNSSELGTQEYWDKRYKSEVNNFRNHGDVGEVWFGEDSVDRIINWMDKSPAIDKTDTIVDIGCGNGMTLVELAVNGYQNLTGFDYSKDAITLAEEIAKTHNCTITYKVNNILNSTSINDSFHIAHDKGTYDAISLSENSKNDRIAYINNVHRYLKHKGLLIITSCNWTEDEILTHFKEKFSLYFSIPTPQFKFGGKIGNVVTSIVLQKID